MKNNLCFWSVFVSHEEKSSYWQHISYPVLSGFGLDRILSPNHLGAGKETARGEAIEIEILPIVPLLQCLQENQTL